MKNLNHNYYTFENGLEKTFREVEEGTTSVNNWDEVLYLQGPITQNNHCNLAYMGYRNISSKRP